MLELWLGVQPFLVSLSFWLSVVGGLILWYLLALLFSHLFFGAGQDAVQAAILGTGIAVVLIPVLVAASWFLNFLSLYYAIALGVLVFMLTLIATLVLRSGARA
jgi:hypothetical protein